MLRTEKIQAGYGSIEILKEVSFEVKEGEIVSLIGANGAGKTTTLMALSGILPLKSGKIFFRNEEISGLSPHKIVLSGISQVPEGRRIFPRLTVLENLELGAFSLKKNLQKDVMDNVFEYFPVLYERKNQLGGTLSGGEQQMLAIGRALMAKPRLLMMDEPSLGLAPIVVEKIFKLIQKMGEAGLTLLLVEQNARRALSIANRGYVMETGQMIMQGDAARLLTDVRIKSAYLGE
ncbi:MAG: ABC transporter ATP-binding protein [Nitrospiria bacterium]